MTGGVALIATGVGLAFVRQFALALPVGFAGFMLLRQHRAIRSAHGSGQTSERAVCRARDAPRPRHRRDGRANPGRAPARGNACRSSRSGELLEVAEEFRGDAESLRLLESYLDRAHPGWRDDVQADETRRQSAASAAGGMDAQEAYQILGLEPGASEAEVRDAHRRLMKQVHPDRGGSAALAAKINEAKDRILGKHR